MTRVTYEMEGIVISKSELDGFRKKLDDQSICKINGAEYVIDSIEYDPKSNSAKVTYLQLFIDNKCKHDIGVYHSYTHVTCNRCGMIKTDSGWGDVSNTWFMSLEHAQKAKDDK